MGFDFFCWNSLRDGRITKARRRIVYLKSAYSMMDYFHQCSLLGHWHIWIRCCHLKYGLFLNSIGWSIFQREMKSFTVYCFGYVLGFKGFLKIICQSLISFAVTALECPYVRSIRWASWGFLSYIIVPCQIKKNPGNLAKSYNLYLLSSFFFINWKIKESFTSFLLDVVHCIWIMEARTIWRYP